ncbi:cryptochrome/photolyase family protein [Brevibacillus dissolubilis]|uniref:cryptochrome/photolyase family protein n=1 Tax=Brevibacillus dissolubilis TaxID=1844116 RepID=UPI00111762AE|nr:deoxyribodipyrimidine photo-lyase [Brevibacillus dissolubilis]
MPTIVWFRRDLRVHDHTALYMACQTGDEIIPVFILDERIYHTPNMGAKRLHTFFSAIRSLQQNLADLGSKLILRKGDPVTILRELAAETGADKLFFNRDYTPFARKRDEAVTEAMEAGGIFVQTYKDCVLHEYNEVLTKAKEAKPYTVFTPYKRSWLKLPKDRPYPIPQDIHIHTYKQIDQLASIHIPTMEEIGLKTPLGEEWAPENFSEKAARDRLQAFMEDDVWYYKERRDFPAVEGTSRLSYALKSGLVSIRTVYAYAMDALEQARGTEAESIETYISELCWRDFYMMVLYHHPHTQERAYLAEFDALTWDDNEELFQKWCQGETGYPIIDAAMKQLNQHGWMHNRLRMITASFLTKDLLIDWRKGMAYFAYQLIDHDDAANIGGWQWSASTGTDPQPYFRIFNPVSQGEKFDPDGEFVKRYLPALANVPKKYIHKPWLMPEKLQHETGCLIGTDYPHPCVDHAIQREMALAIYQEAKKSGKQQNRPNNMVGDPDEE